MPTSHAHDFHQLVLPLQGVINIKVGCFNGKVAPGECVIVKAHEEHLFTANSNARFVVADMQTLPEQLSKHDGLVFAIKNSLLNYLSFVEAQLEQHVNQPLEQAMFATFYLLLEEQTLLPKVDSRISASLMFIHQQISASITINQLAKVACLSDTQFKYLFKKYMGLTPMQYVTKVRMQQAKALLTHTDYPLQIIGERVGYRDLSAFSRKFSQYFGLPPTKFKQ